MSFERLSFHNLCQTLLNRKGEDRVFKNQAITADFFLSCFCDNKVHLKKDSEIATMLVSRTLKERAKQHSWINNDFGTFLLNSFNIDECSKRIAEYATNNNIVIIKDFSEKLRKILTANNLGFNSVVEIKNCKMNKSEYIIDFISNYIKHEDVYIVLAFLLLVSLYPCSYGDKILRSSEDHSDDLIEFIEQYKKQHNPQNIYYNPAKSNNMEDTAATTLLLRTAAGFQRDLAANGIGRFIPPVLSKERPHLDNPTLCSTYSRQEEHLSLEEIIIKHSKSNILAIGRGGCGKTYTLFHLAEKFLVEQCNAIPIYVSLNGFNSNDATNNSIIFDYCCGMLSEYSKFGVDKIRDRLKEWLMEEHDDYILLLLDGFNELTSTDLQVCIVNEVKQLQVKYTNLRFIITSRYDMKDSFACGAGNMSQSFLSYSVDELSPTVVKEYISEFFKKDGKDATKIIHNAMIPGKGDTVKSFLRNPMALVMYCYMNCDDEQKKIFPHKDYSTLGELIDNFVWLIMSYIENDDLRISTSDRVMPFLKYVGFCMNGDGVFKVSALALGKYAKEFGLDLEVTEWEKADFVKDMTKYTMHGTSVTHIEFVHQNYRDYFAADYLKSVLFSGDCNAINSCFGDKIIPEEVCVFLGDILEEYKYKNKSENNDDSVIQSVLTEMCGNLSRAAVAQLIRIAAIARENDLSLFDFSGLDLTAASLNRIKLYKDKRVYARFDRSLLTKTTLNALGHPGSISSMILIEGNRYLVTFSKLGIFCFDMELRNHYRIADYDAYAIRAAVSVNGLNFIVTGDSRGSVALWEYSITDKSELKLHKISCEILYDKGESENNFLCEIQDLVLFNNRIYISVAKGDIWSFVIDSGNISGLSLDITFNNLINTVNPSCRISVSNSALYCSCGDTVTKLQIDTDDRSWISCQKVFSGTEIIDIAIAELEERDDVLINLKRKKENGNALSEVVRYTFEDDTSDIIERRVHSIKRVGFRGWNSFSEPYCGTIYLTANIEDAADTAAGLLKIFLPDSPEDDKTYNFIDVFGNRHTMSVNCAIAFNYKQREYIATGSTERSVEILSAEGTNMALLYHLMGHDNGIHYMDIVDESKMYAAHYSGEVSEWLCRNGHWFCSHVYAVHGNHWVWECRHITFDNEIDKSYVVSCSYDNTIAIINTNTEEIVCRLEEPTSRVLSFGFLSEDIILTGYTKDGNSVLRKFKINYNDKTYIPGPEISELSDAFLEMRSIHTTENRLLLCANSTNNSFIYSIPKKDNLLLDNFVCNRKYEVKENGYRINLRCADEINCKGNGNMIVACGGDSHDSDNHTASYVRVWVDDGKSTPHARFISDSAGCSTLKLTEYEGGIFLISGSYSGFIFVFSVNVTDGEIELINSNVKLNDKILNIQVFEDTIYCSLLSGSVYTLELSKITHKQGSTTVAKEILRSVSGLRCCNVNFSNANKEWDDDFRKLIGYYGKVGR